MLHRSMVNERRGWGESAMKLMGCSGFPEMYAQLGGLSTLGICAFCYI